MNAAFVAVSNIPGTQYKYSIDGVTWHAGANLGAFPVTSSIGIGKNAAGFLAVAYINAGAPVDARSYSSPNGIVWTEHTGFPTINASTAVTQTPIVINGAKTQIAIGNQGFNTANNTVWASVGSSGSNNRFTRSCLFYNGISNTYRTAGYRIIGGIVVQGAGTNIAGAIPVLTGIPASTPGGIINFNNLLFLGAADSNVGIYSSIGISNTNLTAWTNVLPGVNLGRVAKSAAMLVWLEAAGDFIQKTLDGVTWNRHALPNSGAVDIAYSESLNLFSVCFADGSSAYSSDGENWTLTPVVGAPGVGESWLAITA